MQKNLMVHRIVDVCMTILLLCLMAYQITGAALHEWIGIIMTVLVIVHQILNKRWYGALFKGKYNLYRISQTVVNILLIISFILTAVCGMAMSGHAVPFLYGILPVSIARSFHLALSHWAFILMGLHLGLHVPMILSKWKLNQRIRTIFSIISCIIAGLGFYLFLKSGIQDYLFFKVVFAFLDYEKSALMVFLEHICMLVFWAFMGTQIANICRYSTRKDITGKKKWLPACLMVIAVVIGLVLNVIVSGVSV
ncbi:MAG: DUF4405 domain-containing protein [Faecalicoccus sp.]|nr:DUF4405 domain-containing protein [Faecalicoccus sp.]